MSQHWKLLLISEKLQCFPLLKAQIAIHPEQPLGKSRPSYTPGIPLISQMYHVFVYHVVTHLLYGISFKVNIAQQTLQGTKTRLSQQSVIVLQKCSQPLFLQRESNYINKYAPVPQEKKEPCSSR